MTVGETGVTPVLRLRLAQAAVIRDVDLGRLIVGVRAAVRRLLRVVVGLGIEVLMTEETTLELLRAANVVTRARGLLLVSG